MGDNTLWVEKYRPDTLENYIGNDNLKAKLEQFIKNQDIPHLLFCGTAVMDGMLAVHFIMMLLMLKLIYLIQTILVKL